MIRPGRMKLLWKQPETFLLLSRLLELQKQELKKRVLLRARRFARKQYKEFLDQLLKNASGDYNDQEHFVAEVEQWLSAVAVANDSKDLHDKAEADLVNLQHQLSIVNAARLQSFGISKLQLRTDLHRVYFRKLKPAWRTMKRK
ncbi:hypothetical protein RvY_08808-3 [Ramazzottius varieornatus]|uniref:Uncharacterized protein n=1 Tax=Ramazzottius varieornatus TaxID=947166 RepID=A0A1D1V757_RAMVA|nr:hypothetical protein RvY_08808-3 [Ramazzottius varieornatus]